MKSIFKLSTLVASIAAQTSMLTVAAVTAGTLMAVAPTGVDAAPRVVRSNVACNGLSVSGFQVIGGTIEKYVHHEWADQCDGVDVVLIPADVDMWDPSAVSAYLTDLGKTDFEIVLRRGGSDCGAINRDPDGSCFEDDGIANSVDGINLSRSDNVVNGGW